MAEIELKIQSMTAEASDQALCKLLGIAPDPIPTATPDSSPPSEVPASQAGQVVTGKGGA